MLPIH